MDHNPDHHEVTVSTRTEVDNGEAYTSLEEVRFTCTAPPDAPCRRYPSCECEYITEDTDAPGHDHAGHPYVVGQDCWVQSWFDADPMGLATAYVGADASLATDCGVPPVVRSGRVRVVGFDDAGPEWEWADDA